MFDVGESQWERGGRMAIHHTRIMMRAATLRQINITGDKTLITEAAMVNDKSSLD